ncbi:4Fe-4S dicluster domain-containing protein [Phytohabitans kaempferiae]|uniref:Ferredoxin family protein n=1 Tax=Phytohabitans kaempferiae TaxID=1620943 RepID=A0ABV6LZJ3_9ACTN
MPPRIDPDVCTLCGKCQDVCPGDILHIDRGVGEMVRYPDECSHCDVCRVECPAGAIEIAFPWSLLQQPVTIEIRERRDD